LTSKTRLRAIFYPVGSHSVDAEVAAKLDLVMRADRAARDADPRIFQVRAGYSDELRRILVVGSDGTYATDSQPLARFNVFCLAKEGTNTSRGSAEAADASASNIFRRKRRPNISPRKRPPGHHPTRRARSSAGEMEVVLGPGWPGILLHEAIGHGLEADFNRKKTSAFAGMLGKRVASDKCTVVDNGLCRRVAAPSMSTTKATLLRTPCSSRRESLRDISATNFPRSS